MHDRRYKLVLISINVIISWGKDAGDKLKKLMPDGSVVINKEEDLATGSVAFLVHNPDWELVEDGELLPVVCPHVEIEAIAEESTLIAYPH